MARPIISFRWVLSKDFEEGLVRSGGMRFFGDECHTHTSPLGSFEQEYDDFAELSHRNGTTARSGRIANGLGEKRLSSASA